MSAVHWVGSLVGSSPQAEVISRVMERIFGYLPLLKFLECENNFEVREITVLSCLSIWNNSALAGRIFTKFYVGNCY